MKEARITVVMPEELKERIQKAADAAYLPCSIWCRQHLVNALPKEPQYMPTMSEKEQPPVIKKLNGLEIQAQAIAIKPRVLTILENETDWITARDVAEILGEDEKVCIRALMLLQTQDKAIAIYKGDDSTEVKAIDARYKIIKGAI